ncbi:MAG: NAD(P)H-dependent oxidoreductase subunit E [Myxococcales bacterium]|nr:NAD(P)H-dependent oxidoreductase subunit E [Myxococcales bacterium]
MSEPSATSAAPLAFSADAKARIAGLLARYPQDRKQAALIPALYVAQDEFGWLKPEVMELVARELDVPLTAVLSTAMFYTMLKKQPLGRWHVQVCTNVSCYLRGCDGLMDVARQELGIGPGETTSDGLFTLSAVECLAACGMAPALQIGKKDHFNVSTDQMRQMLQDLKADARAHAPALAAAPTPLPSSGHTAPTAGPHG